MKPDISGAPSFSGYDQHSIHTDAFRLARRLKLKTEKTTTKNSVTEEDIFLIK
jgi:hypothetical protein